MKNVWIIENKGGEAKNELSSRKSRLWHQMVF